MNDVWYEDEYKYTVMGTVSVGRRNRLCAICKADHGYCSACDFKRCEVDFHVPCARREGYIRPKDRRRTTAANEDEEDYVFCHAHRLRGESILANTR